MQFGGDLPTTTTTANVDPYWSEHVNRFGSYNCPNGCVVEASGNPRSLKPKIVKKDGENNGRAFVSCSKEYGGCGLFSFLDEKPKAFALTFRQKRQRSDGDGNFVTNGVAMPDETQKTLADISAKLNALSAKVDQLLAANTQ